MFVRLFIYFNYAYFYRKIMQRKSDLVALLVVIVGLSILLIIVTVWFFNQDFSYDFDDGNSHPSPSIEIWKSDNTSSGFIRCPNIQACYAT